VALQTLLNDKYKLESLQGDGSRIRQAIPQNARWKARACNCRTSITSLIVTTKAHLCVFVWSLKW